MKTIQQTRSPMVSYEEFENRLRRECVGDTKKTPPLSFGRVKEITGCGDMLTMSHMLEFGSNYKIHNLREGYVFDLSIERSFDEWLSDRKNGTYT